METINTKVNTTQSEWRFEDDMNHSIYVEKKSGGKDYITGYTSGKANAALIVKAVNNHYDLVEALTNMVAFYEGDANLAYIDKAKELLNSLK